MDSRTALIHRKVAKMESLLFNLNTEIYTASSYLALLRNTVNPLVKSLNAKTEPTEYLEEYLRINAFIMKSLSFVSEFNSKFELLNIFDKSGNNFIPENEVFSSVLMSQILEKAEGNLNLESVRNDIEITERIPVEEPVDESSFVQVKEASFYDSSESNSPDKLYSEGSSTKFEQPKASTSKEIVSDYHEKKFGKCLGNKPNSEKTKSPSVFNGTKNVQKPFPNVILDCLNKQSSFLTKESYSQIARKGGKDTSSDLCSGIQPNQNYNVPESVIAKVKDWWTNAEVANKVDTQESTTDGHKSSKSEPKRDLENEDIKPICLFDKIDKEYEVTIEHIVSPSDFYVLLTSTRELLKELERKLKLIPPSRSTSLINHTGKRKTVLSREIGKYALVYLKCEEIWARARIMNWSLHLNNDFASVFLLDYGESKCVSVNDLQPMPVEFKVCPGFAIRCHLHNLYPIDSDFDAKKLNWGKEAIENFCSLVETSNKVKIKVMEGSGQEVSKGHNRSLPVRLLLIENENRCVNELLIKNKCGVLRPVPEAAGKNEKKNNPAEKNELKNWNPMKEDFNSYNNTYDFDVNDPAAIIYGYVGKDYERVCKHFSKTGHCFKGEACKQEHDELNPSGFTTDHEEIYKSAFNTLRIPSVNSIINVQVTCVLAYNKFFCFPECKNLSVAEENLHSLLNLINNVENVKRMKKLLVPPSAGQVVIARFSEDDAWYRARIIESHPEEDKYVIGFVDYGNKETHSLVDLRAIEPRYLHLPFQAMECTISGIEESPNIPEKDVIDYLRGRMDDGHISIRLISQFPGEHIKLLVHVFDKNGINIGDDMVAKKYAVFKEEELLDAVSEVVVPG